MAKRRSSKAHMAYVRSFRKGAKRRKAAPARKRRVRRARRNPYPVAGMVVGNPRKRRTSRRRHAVARRTRRHSKGYSRNPRIFGIELPPVQKVIFAGVGFVAPPMIEGMVAGFIPASIQSTTMGKYAVRIGIVAALGWAVSRFLGREKGNMTLIGGGVYVATTAALEFFPSLFGAHAPVMVSAQAPAGLTAYVPANRMLGSYVAANQRINNSLGGSSAAYANSQSSGAVGGTANRFSRF